MDFKKLTMQGTATGPQPNIRPPMQVGGMEAPGPEPGEGSPQEEAEDRASGEREPPPTPRDHKQAITHELSSISYNAKHAAAHHQETAKHSTKLLNLLKNVPGFAEHARKV